MLLPLLLGQSGGVTPPPIPVPSAPTFFQATYTVNNLIQGALKRINSYSPGQRLNGVDVADVLETLNDMLDSWSLDKLMVFSSNENILSWVGGKNEYSVGVTVGGIFTGQLQQGSEVITNVTVPGGVIVGSGVVDALNYLPSGTTVTSIGTNSLQLSANALSTTVLAEQFQYTIPGDFAIPRPLRITKAFSRFSTSSGALDFPIDIISEGQWTELGLKQLPGPWPLVIYYNPTYPFGTIYCYPAPSAAVEVHIWTDTIISEFQNVTQPINLPQGYSRAIKWNLAQEIWPEYYDDPLPGAIIKMAKESKDAIRNLNAIPAAVANYDAALMGHRRANASWILSGGFAS